MPEEKMNTAAREAIRIADTYLSGSPIEMQKKLALEIVHLVERCEAEFGAEIVRRLSH